MPETKAEYQLKIPSRTDNLELIREFVSSLASKVGFNSEDVNKIELAVDEACTNVIRHAFPEGAKGEITIACSPVADGLLVRILDQGKPFDPQQGIKIAMAKRLQAPASGGIGLSLIRQLVDKVQYQWDEREGNQLTLIKRKNEK